MNRLEALMSGNPRYDTDKPCKYGHVAQRYARNGGCVTCVHLSAKKCNNNYLTVGEEINSKTKLIYLFARENDFPAIKMSLDCFLALSCKYCAFLASSSCRKLLVKLSICASNLRLDRCRQVNKRRPRQCG